MQNNLDNPELMCYLCTRKTDIGTLAERLGNGLQNRVEQFDSARYLDKKDVHLWASFFVAQRQATTCGHGKAHSRRQASHRQAGPRKDGRMTGKNKNAPHFTVGGITQ